MKYFLLLTLAVLVITSSLNAQDFTRIEEEAGINHLHIDDLIMGGGSAFFDYNNDGLLDIYVTGGDEMDKLYENIGNSMFIDVSISAGFSITDGIKTTGVCTGDIDNDGDRDIFVATYEDAACLLFENLGDGNFSNISVDAGIVDTSWSTSITMGDYNMDGYLDIYVANYVRTTGLPEIPFYEQLEEALPNYFYINNGNNTFTESAEILGVNNAGAGLAVAFTDYDGDNDIDLYVANDFGGQFASNEMLKNNYPNDSFTMVGSSTATNASINAMGIAIGDFDEEMSLDYYVSNMSANKFYKNSEINIFSEVATETNTLCAQYVSWGNYFFDYNNDSYLDLFVANGGVLMQDINRAQPNSMFTGDSSYVFTESILFTGQEDSSISRGAIFGDIDNDGDLDMFITNLSNGGVDSSSSFLIQNNNDNGFNWVKIKTEGTINNFDGFGTKIRLYSNGRSFLREVGGGSSYMSQNTSIVHFGLGENSIIDSIEVVWLGGDTQTIYTIASNQMIHIKEGNSYNFSVNSICEGDSVQFSNEWISIEGIYYDTVLTTLGIDSVISLTLITNPEYFNEQTLTINEGDSVFLEGGYQSTEGVYTDVFTSVEGCDSTVVTTLSIDIINGINELSGSKWILYPNPSNGMFSLDFNESLFIDEVEIYSILGKQIMKNTINNYSERIDFNLQEHPEGIYFISIRSNGQNITLRLILNK